MATDTHTYTHTFARGKKKPEHVIAVSRTVYEKSELIALRSSPQINYSLRDTFMQSMIKRTHVFVFVLELLCACVSAGVCA